jgi:leader peptidase (prepilin peptidase) / N-methyltransferase
VTALRAVVFGLFGLPIGSFMTVVVSRLPQKQSVVAPRSRCPACGTEIWPRDNVPVLSWVALRGKCRSCGERISVVYPMVELSTAALFVGSALVFDHLLVAVMMSLFLGLMPAIAVIDWRHKIIPNLVVYPALIAFPLYILVAWLAGDPLDPLDAAIGFAAYGGGLLLIAIVVPGGMGMGDVKLVALIGLVLGSLGLRYVFVAAGAGILLGGVGAIVALIIGLGRKQAIPFGPFLAAGAVVAGLWGPRIADVYLDLVT